MAIKTVEITICDIPGCEAELRDWEIMQPCFSCGAIVCLLHKVSLTGSSPLGEVKLGKVCLPCIEVKLGITPKENA